MLGPSPGVEGIAAVSRAEGIPKAGIGLLEEHPEGDEDGECDLYIRKESGEKCHMSAV